MKSLNRYAFTAATLLLAIFGFSKLSNSVIDGRDAASDYVRTSMGGSMDSEDFRSMMEGYILSNITAGSIMFLAGLTFFCLTIYKFVSGEDGVDK